MKRSTALKLAHAIISDKRNENKYGMTQIRNMETLEVEATYYDAVKVIEEIFKEESKK